MILFIYKSVVKSVIFAFMLVKFRNWLRSFRLSLRMKLILALSAIAVVLTMSSVISVLEYRRMSTYVSNLIARDISNIHVAQQLVDAVDGYHLQVLAVIGDDNLNTLPDFDRTAFLEYCDSLKQSLGEQSALPLADSVLYAYSAYMLASLELESVIQSTFINSRDWYFTRLQPLFNRLRGYLDRMSAGMYEELRQNSEDFDSGIFRSIVPGIVAVGVGILLVFLLMFYMLVYYVHPLYHMLGNLTDYLKFRRHYTFTFEGDDQLTDLNRSITDLTEENRQLRRRLSDLKDKQ